MDEEEEPSNPCTTLVLYRPPDDREETEDVHSAVADILNLNFFQQKSDDLDDPGEENSDQVNDYLRLQLLEKISEVETLKTENIEFKNKNAKLNEENVKLKEKLEKLQDEIADLEKDLDTAEKALEEYQREEDDTREVDNRILSTKVRKQAEEIEKKEQQLKEAEEIMLDLVKEKNDLEETLHDEKREKEMHKEKCLKLTKSVTEVNQQLETFLSELKDCPDPDLQKFIIDPVVKLQSLEAATQLRIDKLSRRNLSLKKDLKEINKLLKEVFCQVSSPQQESPPFPPPPQEQESLPSPSPRSERELPPSPPPPVVAVPVHKHQLLKSKVFCKCSPNIPYKTEKSAKKHLENVKATWSLACFACPLRYRTLPKLKYHLYHIHRIVLNPVQFCCLKCAKQFKTEEKLNQHLILVHKLSEMKTFLRNVKQSRTRYLQKLKALKRKLKARDKKIKSSNKHRTLQTNQGRKGNDKNRKLQTSQGRKSDDKNRKLQTNQDLKSSDKNKKFRTSHDSKTKLESSKPKDIIEKRQLPLRTCQTSSPSPPINHRPPVEKPLDRPSTKKAPDRPSTMMSPDRPAPILFPAVFHHLDPDCSQPHTCICGFRFQTGENLARHVARDKDAEWKFKCSHCDQKFYLFKRLNKHLVEVHKDTSVGVKYVAGCYSCGTFYGTKEEYTKHRQDIHNYVMPTPPVPLITVKIEPVDRPDHAVDNSRASRQSGVFRCVCGFETGLKHNLTNHINYKTKPPVFKCERCTQAFYEIAKLKAHISKKHGVEWSKCGCRQCGETFSTREELNDHRAQQHPVRRVAQIDLTEGDNEEGTGQAGLPSPDLGISPPPPLPKESNSLKLLIKLPSHRQDTTKEGLHCTCGKAFLRVEYLTRHLASNTGVKWFDCNICKKTFKSLGLLRRHMKNSHKATRLPPNRFGCSSCGAVFMNQSHLMIHRKEKHRKTRVKAMSLKRATFVSAQIHGIDWKRRDQGHYCLCGTKTSTKANLNKHLNHFSRDGTAICDLCGDRVRKGDLGEHTVTKHGATKNASEAIRRLTRQAEGTSAENGGGPEPVIASTSRGPSIVIATGLRSQDFTRLAGNRTPTFGDVDLATTGEPELILDAHLSSTFFHTENTERLANNIAECECGKAFRNRRRLKAHVSYFSTKDRFKCLTCRRGFLTTGELKGHMWRSHRIVYNTNNGCRTCGATFSTIFEWARHIRKEHPPEPEQRDVKFSPMATPRRQAEVEPLPRLIDTEEHKMREAGPFGDQCKCGLTFANRSSLRTHVWRNKHTLKMMVFKCHLCDERFSQHRPLKYHVVKAHEVPYDKGDYGCYVCGKTFDTRKQVLRHSNLHRTQ